MFIASSEIKNEKLEISCKTFIFWTFYALICRLLREDFIGADSTDSLKKAKLYFFRCIIVAFKKKIRSLKDNIVIYAIQLVFVPLFCIINRSQKNHSRRFCPGSFCVSGCTKFVYIAYIDKKIC